MRNFYLVLSLLIFINFKVFADFAVNDGDRVVVYGDSITAGAEYPNYVRYLETYLRTRFPKKFFSFWNRGWSGDVASNFPRFNRDCLKLNPDVIFISLGMNDAAYKPEIAPGLRLFLSNLQKMVEAAKKVNSKVRIYLVSPNLYEYKATNTRSFYPYVLWCYAREEKKLAKQLGVNFIDLNRLYGQSIGLAHSVFPKTLVFSGDSIHPLPNGGYLFMALAIIRALKINSDLGAMIIENGKIKVQLGQSAKIVSQTPEKIIIERRLNVLPLAAVKKYKGITYLDQSVAFLECMADEFNKDTLNIFGLTANAYRLIIDGKFTANISKEELESGINLSEFKNTSLLLQSEEVANLIGEKQILQDSFWRQGLGKEKTREEIKGYKLKISNYLAKIKKNIIPSMQSIVLEKLNQKVELYKRYEQCLEIAVPKTLAVGSTRKTGEISVTLKNLSGSILQSELFWNNSKIKPVFLSVDLKPGEKKELGFKADLFADSALPKLKIKSRPEDGSFPSFLEEKTIPLIATLEVFRAAKVITVDGKLDDWSMRPAFTLDKRFTASARLKTFGSADFGADVNLSWDAKFLYIGVLVRDQSHVNSFTDNRISWDDSITISLGQSGVSFSFALTSEGAKINPKPENLFPFVVKREKLSTIYEIAIPWKMIKVANPQKGSKHKFNIIVNDRDRDESCKSLSLSGSMNPWAYPCEIILK